MDNQTNNNIDPNQVIDTFQKDSDTDNEQTKAFNKYQKASGENVSMQVKVHSPFRMYFDGPAFSISAESDTGPFDILPKHHNFISLLSPCDLIIRTVDQGAQKVSISGGIIHIKADEVIVFLDV
ncbi:MAG TPA: F0F1 ATP synthase subunit epsilon [Candidatus Saccharimonadales bacterium]|nr:F0F1 ATP synthase subunit epsilon [Candidatus Saccharimonadales bacterium]